MVYFFLFYAKTILIERHTKRKLLKSGSFLSNNLYVTTCSFEDIMDYLSQQKVQLWNEYAMSGCERAIQIELSAVLLKICCRQHIRIILTENSNLCFLNFADKSSHSMFWGESLTELIILNRNAVATGKKKLPITRILQKKKCCL